MITTEYDAVTCPICGRTRTITRHYDDGMDWLGHQRGASGIFPDKVDPGCKCGMGPSKEKIIIKPMCINCKFQEKECCTNYKQVNNISNLFQIETPLKIKDSTMRCEYHELDYEKTFKNAVKIDYGNDGFKFD